MPISTHEDADIPHSLRHLTGSHAAQVKQPRMTDIALQSLQKMVDDLHNDFQRLVDRIEPSLANVPSSPLRGNAEVEAARDVRFPGSSALVGRLRDEVDRLDSLRARMHEIANRVEL